MANKQIKLFSITKWRWNSKKTGVIVQLTHYDAESKTFTNEKAHIALASQFAGKAPDEQPATLAKVDKDGNLWLRCTRFDDYIPTPTNDARGAMETAGAITYQDIPF